MSNTLNNISLISTYNYGSPRYHTILNLPTVIIPEDYVTHDAVQGTYDMNFPLYVMTNNNPPVIELVDENSNINQIKGSLAPYLSQKAYMTKQIGKQATTTIPTNTNLDSQTISYDEYLHINVNPSWCTIQNNYVSNTNSNTTITPRFLVRVLGNSILISDIYALTLASSNLGVSNTLFPVGIIVSYNNNLWINTQSTNLYPPSTANAQSDYWNNLNGITNIFNADLFFLSSNGTSYFTSVSDDSRDFNPLTEDDTLVAWNLSYYQE